MDSRVLRLVEGALEHLRAVSEQRQTALGAYANLPRPNDERLRLLRKYLADPRSSDWPGYLSVTTCGYCHSCGEGQLELQRRPEGQIVAERCERCGKPYRFWAHGFETSDMDEPAVGCSEILVKRRRHELRGTKRRSSLFEIVDEDRRAVPYPTHERVPFAVRKIKKP